MESEQNAWNMVDLESEHFLRRVFNLLEVRSINRSTTTHLCSWVKRFSTRSILLGDTVHRSPESGALVHGKDQVVEAWERWG